MTLITWDDALSCNIHMMDLDHKKLVDLLNQVNDAMIMGKGQEILKDVVKELIDYTIYHFHKEETLMKTYGYSGHFEHINQHNDFVKKMQEYHNSVSMGNFMFTIDLKNYLKNWLINHIQTIDKKFSVYLTSRGVT